MDVSPAIVHVILLEAGHGATFTVKLPASPH